MRVDLCLQPKTFRRQEVLEALPSIRQMLEQHRARLAYLFGSVLADGAGPLSDVDIAVLPDPEGYHWLHTYSDIYEALCRTLGADNVDVVMLNEALPSFQFAVLREGIPIWVADEEERVAYTERVMARYHDAQRWRQEHWRHLRRRVEEGMSVADRSLDPRRVHILLGRMDEAVMRLCTVAPSNLEVFLSEEGCQVRALVEHFLRLAIEAALDLGRHIIAVKGFGLPEEYRDVARVLRENGVASPHLADRLAMMAGLRNILVHRYWDIDYRRLYHAATEGLTDFDDYGRAILEYVEQERS